MKRRAVYPGTFDPLTNGHIDIIRRAAKMFDEIIVAVACNRQKNPMIPFDDRVKLVERSLSGMKNVTVDRFQGLVVNYVKSKNAKVVIRGLRMISDFEYEFQMALTNRKLDKNIETIFMMPSEEYSYVSSKLIKEAAALGAGLKDLVPPAVEKKLKGILKEKGF